MAKLLQPEIQDFFNGLCCDLNPPTQISPTIEYTQTSLTFMEGTAVNICPSTLSGSPTIVVTVDPPLPAGLSLNPSTGCITGTPTTTSATTQYIFTATNSVGSDQDAIDITVSVLTLTTCYQKVVTTEPFTAQSNFPAKIALTGTGTLQETVYGLTYVTGAEADGQYSLRNGGGNDLNGSSSSYGIAFNFAIQGGFVPYKIYSQKLIGTPGDTYKGGFWARERSGGIKARFSYRILNGATVLATGLTGEIPTSYTNFRSGTFVMPPSGEVTIEIFNELNGSASGNDPVMDGVGLAQVTSTTTKYKKVSSNGTDSYFYENGTPVTGTALTTLISDISSGVATTITCTF